MNENHSEAAWASGLGLFTLACPLCRGPVSPEGPVARCTVCGEAFPHERGIWRFLPASRACRFSEFLRRYRTVRRDEGWGSPQADYYRALPSVAWGDPQRSIWRLRAAHMAVLLRLLAGSAALRILDAGAGNGWLSNRLAACGHIVAALDISDDPYDGLGARAHYAPDLPCFQAEYDHLPFASGHFDLVLFNASLHYTAALAPTLNEASRVLKSDGRIVVMDSPFYTRPASGMAMLADRETGFARRYGFEPRSPEIGFLTETALRSAAGRIGLQTAVLADDNNWRRRVQRALAYCRTGREPARFPLIVLQRSAACWPWRSRQAA